MNRSEAATTPTSGKPCIRRADDAGSGGNAGGRKNRSPGTTRAARLVLCLSCLLSACSWFDEKFETTHFVGKWKSSRADTPIRLYGNGEWEMQASDGSVLQYGIWQLVGKDILWSNRVHGHIQHDPNAVLSVSPREFKIRERNGGTTTFVRID